MEEEMTQLSIKHFCPVGDVISGELSVNMYLGYFQACYLFHFLGQGDEADKTVAVAKKCFIYYYVKKRKK